MTKQAVLPAHADIVEAEVEVEIDAMDVAEWESGQQTPQACDKNLAELVRRTAKLPALTADGEPILSPPVLRARQKTAMLVPVRRPPAKLAVPPPMSHSTMVGLPVGVQRAPARTPVPDTRAAGVPPSAARGIDVSPRVRAKKKPAVAPLPVLRTDGELEVTVPFIYTSTGGAPKGEPPPPVEPAATASAEPKSEPPPPVEPAAIAFAEPSRTGPGHGSSPAGSVESNTAWPPQPIPAGNSSSFDRLAASDGMLRATGRDAEGTAQLRVAFTRRRPGWIAGTAGAISLGVIVAAALLRAPEPGRAPSPDEDSTPGSAPAASEVAAPPAAPGATPDRPAPPPAAAVPGAPTAHGPEAGFDPPASVVATEPSTPAPRSPPARHAAKRIAGKKVVVDYTVRQSDAPPPSLVAQSEEDPAVGRARTAYVAGNEKLFAGDLDGAIGAYGEALEIYPGYVGGYRGLGLAYAQAGDNTRALAALRTYVTAVPNARDAALIKKRIARLQGK